MIYRLPLLRSRNELDSWVSREAAFLVNNWILLFSAFFVLFATMFPTLSEAVTRRAADGRRRRSSTSGCCRSAWSLLLLTGIGPLLAWRKSTRRRTCASSSCGRCVAGVVTGVVLVALGRAGLGRRASASRSARSSPATIVQEFLRGARVRQAGDRHRPLHGASSASSAASKRRYGGYIVHVGIVLIFLGFAGEGFKQEEQVLLKPGQQAHGRAGSRCATTRVQVTDDGQKQMVTGTSDGVRRTARRSARCIRRKWFFRKHEEEPTTEVAIRRGAGEDLYIVMPALRSDGSDRRACRCVINPLVNWIWIGFGVMALGTGIALLPERAFSFAVAKLPGRGGHDCAVVLLIVLLLARRRAARSTSRAGQAVPIVSRSPLEREMQRSIICMCGTCGRKLLSRVPVQPCGEMRAELSRLRRRRGQDPRTDRRRTTSRSTAARSRWHRRSTRLQSPRVGRAVRPRGGRPRRRRPGRGALVAPERCEPRVGTRRVAHAEPTDATSKRASTMSSATLTDEVRRQPSSDACRLRSTRRAERRALSGQATSSSSRRPFSSRERAIVMRQQTPAVIVLAGFTVAAAGYAAYALYRSLLPLVSAEAASDAMMIGGRTRAALERDKALTLRSLKELDFDHAMGKIAAGDYTEMRDRLRTRAIA